MCNGLLLAGGKRSFGSTFNVWDSIFKWRIVYWWRPAKSSSRTWILLYYPFKTYLCMRQAETWFVVHLGQGLQKTWSKDMRCSTSVTASLSRRASSTSLAPIWERRRRRWTYWDSILIAERHVKLDIFGLTGVSRHSFAEGFWKESWRMTFCTLWMSTWYSARMSIADRLNLWLWKPTEIGPMRRPNALFEF